MEIVKGEGVPDSVLLEDISENGFVNNQRIRYDKKLIYSYIGNVVISLNPFQKLDIYGKQQIEQYKGRYIYERPPHIYALANEAYRSMTTNKENQCIIISGESGAGKTEASKIILGFIAAASKQSKDVEAINELLLQSNPIMEAFGNAKTTRNDNSSRFGKYMEIEFNYNGAPIGGKITVYLLEKSRVVTRALSERSFHCFYQMLNGLSDAELRELKLTRNVENYAYLDSSKCAKVDTINDSSDFKAVLAAAKILGFSNDEMSQIWKILAAILHLGNIKFKPNDSEGVCIANEDLSNTISSLLSISHKLFSNSLIQRTIVSGVSKKASLIIVHMNMEQAIFTRDAMAKGIYFRLFSWIVEKINLKISQQMTKMSQDKLSIGILDIYGFEVFQVNSFEQFCINWANEKLQQVFIELTLKGEQEEYEKEGIAWSHIDYFNNQVIIDLIEQKPIGIVSLMDEECTLGKSTDRTFLDKIGTQFANHNRFTVYNAVKKDPTMNPNSFKLLHYAGDVVYDVTGFLEKSKDTLYSDIIMGLQSSSLAVVSQLFPIEEERTAKRPVTVATQFKTAVNELVRALLSCRPHYVRCIKANHQKRSFYFDEDCIKHQVRYLGLVENVRVRRAGFAYRHTYWHFLNRYKMLCKDTWPKNRTKDLKSGTESILKEHNIPTSEYQLGKTKVFVKNPKTLFYFEEKRVAKLPEVAVKIQAVWRGYWARKKYGKRKAASTILDTYKKYRFRKWFLELQKAFHNVKQDPDFGKTTTWPKPPPTLGTADVLIHKIHKTWRASQIIKRIPKEQLPYVKQKIITCDIFKGKKPYDLQRKFEADYLDSPNIPNRNKYEQAVQTLFKRFGDTQVLFSGFVDKVNRKGKIDKRAIVITEQNIYKQNPKDYKVKTFGTEGFGIPIVDLEAISMSPNADGFVVLHVSQNVDKDALMDVGLKPEKLSELVTVLVTAYNKLTNKDLPVRFSNDIKYYLESHKKEQTSLVFQKDVTVQEPVFKKGKGKVDNVLFN